MVRSPTARLRRSELAARQRLRVVAPRPGIGDRKPTPRLVVFISIDQMRGDYITRTARTGRAA